MASAPSPAAGGASRVRLLPAERTWTDLLRVDPRVHARRLCGAAAVPAVRGDRRRGGRPGGVSGAFSLAAFVAARYVAAILNRLGPRIFALVTRGHPGGGVRGVRPAPSLWLTVVAMALMGAASGGVRPATMARLAAVAKQARGGGVPTSVVARMETAFGVCNALLILVGGLLIAYASFEAALIDGAGRLPGDAAGRGPGQRSSGTLRPANARPRRGRRGGHFRLKTPAQIGALWCPPHPD